MKAKLVYPMRFNIMDNAALFEAEERAIKSLSEVAIEINSPFLRANSKLRFKVSNKISNSLQKRFSNLYRNKGWIKRWTHAAAYLISDFDLDFVPLSKIRELLRDSNKTHSTDVLCVQVSSRSISNDISDRVFDLSVCANLANLGTFRLDNGAIIIGKNIFPKSGFVSECESAREASISQKWPIISEVDLGKFYKWYQLISGTTKGHSENSLGRAICSFSYLFHREIERRSLSDLIWSLSGIEALLGETDQSRRLITEKLLLILRPEKDFSAEKIKKTMRELYDFRSRMLHGNRNICSQRLELDDDTLEWKKYVSEEFAATANAIAILSQLILFCYAKGLKEIPFNLALSEKNSV